MHGPSSDQVMLACMSCMYGSCVRSQAHAVEIAVANLAGQTGTGNTVFFEEKNREQKNRKKGTVVSEKGTHGFF